MPDYGHIGCPNTSARGNETLHCNLSFPHDPLPCNFVRFTETPLARTMLAPTAEDNAAPVPDSDDPVTAESIVTWCGVSRLDERFAFTVMGVQRMLNKLLNLRCPKCNEAFIWKREGAVIKVFAQKHRCN